MDSCSRQLTNGVSLQREAGSSRGARLRGRGLGAQWSFCPSGGDSAGVIWRQEGGARRPEEARLRENWTRSFLEGLQLLGCLKNLVSNV